MFISCSSKGQIWKIPESGIAQIAGFWDPVKAPVRKPMLIEWQDGKLVAIKENNSEVSNNISVHPWQSYYLLPGWIDAHVHLALDSIDFKECLNKWQQELLMEESIQSVLRKYLELGIVAIRDGGDLNGYGWKSKKKVASGEWIGPEITSVHEALFHIGSYGRFLGRGINNIEEWIVNRDLFFQQGLDQVKIIVTGLISFREYGVVGSVQWSYEELKQIVKDAHNHGLRVMAHVSGIEGISLAIEAGVDSIEHGYYMTAEHIKRISKEGIAWVPTVAPVGNLLARVTHRYNLEEKEILRRILHEQLEKIYEAYLNKVSLGIGTDAGAYLVPHADSLLDEMTWMAEAGIPTLEVRRMAILENAKILGLDHGRLQPGVRMDRLQLSDQISGSIIKP